MSRFVSVLSSGYGVLDFPYIQPALSAEQQPVFNLLLLCKIFNSNWQQKVPSDRVKTIVHEYLRWAMRIDEPADCKEYHATSDFLDKHSEIKVLNLGRYVGFDLAKPVEIRAVESEGDEDFQAVMSVYQGAFAGNPLGVQPQDFIEALHADPDYAYHLWSIRNTAADPVEGMVSFFTFPAAGFGGYFVFEGKLQGQGNLRPVVARMEQQMLQDRPDTRGWYIETDALKSPDLWLHLGFYEIAMSYEQPPLSEQGTGLIAKLLYKPYGRVYGEPSLSHRELVEAIAQIYRGVYQIDRPAEHPSYLKSIASIQTAPTERVKFCPLIRSSV